MEIKIKSYKIGQRGLRGFAVSVPKVWIDDLELKEGDLLDFYRDENDRLILVANKKEPAEVK